MRQPNRMSQCRNILLVLHPGQHPISTSYPTQPPFPSMSALFGGPLSPGLFSKNTPLREAPIAGSIILATVLLKLGGYGMIRIIQILSPLTKELYIPLPILHHINYHHISKILINRPQRPPT
uniref:NADH:ubiquinone reductase (H(+)-translocating) n=1 Tax=Monopterus albus TaxID=43700 RepID=A0A3Q3JV52_MONAL